MSKLACVLALIAAAAHGETLIPRTPAGETFAAWLTSFNSGDAAQIAAFRDTYKREVPVEDTLSWRKDTGGFQLLRIEESTANSLIAILKEADSDHAARFTLARQGDGVGANLTIGIQGVPLPAEFAPPRMTLDDALASLASLADQRTREDRFSGALLVARKGKVLLEKAWGHADRDAQTPVTPNTQFRLGSMNKMFTAVATLQLVEAGKLSLDGALGRYLPDYPNRDAAAKVTVRHLLRHMGGTGDIFGPEFDAHRLTLREHSDYVKLFGARPLEHEPGVKQEYSNYGFVLLGALIEKVSGMSYYDYVRARVYEPAGMRATGSQPESAHVPARAAGYTRKAGRWASNADTLPYRGMAAGGGYSTVGDLLRFAEALQSGRLISQRMLAEATHDDGKGYGYGFVLLGEGPQRTFGHGGGAPGMNAELRIFPALGYVLVGLSNLDPPAAENMVEHFAMRMPID